MENKVIVRENGLLFIVSHLVLELQTEKEVFLLSWTEWTTKEFKVERATVRVRESQRGRETKQASSIWAH